MIFNDLKLVKVEIQCLQHALHVRTSRHRIISSIKILEFMYPKQDLNSNDYYETDCI